MGAIGKVYVSCNFNNLILLCHGDVNKHTLWCSCGAVHMFVRRRGTGVKSDETSTVVSNIPTDPLLVLRNSGIHTRILR